MSQSAARQGRRKPIEPPMVVDPRWLLKAGAVMLGVAFVCGYVTLCWLFYQGQWQLVLHPVKTAARPAAIGGAPFAMIRFGPDGSGLPQRTAWVIPAAANDPYRHLTVLYLPSGDGSLNDALPTLEALQRVGIAVFAVQYRGYGESAGGPPGERTMREDAESAWRYLVQEQKVDGRLVVPFGAGVGCALAMGLLQQHPEISAVVLQSPPFDLVARVKADPRVRFLPVDRLLHDRFAMEPALAASKTPKLLLTEGATEPREITAAGEPKMTVEMTHFDEAQFAAALRRFLDAYAPSTPPVQLMPQAAPVAAK